MGFIPTPERPKSDRFLLQQLQDVQSARSLGQLVAQRLAAGHHALSASAVNLDWDPTQVEAWTNGTQEFDPGRARALAEALDLDVPLFVGKALEVTLRRDLSNRVGERA